MYTLSTQFSEFTRKPKTRKEISTYLMDVVDILCRQNSQIEDINRIFEKYDIQGFEDIKMETIDLLIGYANYILEDSVITAIEAYDFEALKRIFRIKEGEFLQYRSFELREILKKEFIRIYSDNFVDKKEDLETLNLQGLFNLSYDQFEEIKKGEVIQSLLKGANPKDLSISKIPKGFNML